MNADGKHDSTSAFIRVHLRLRGENGMAKELGVGTSYDQVPYRSYPFPQSHPERLAAIATVLGMDPPAIQTCRVLELGGSAGGNIIPLAEQLPRATFLGIDASTRQIADGQHVIQQVGLKNVELRHMDIMDVTPELGQFDYIICHGVYSWVPQPVQQKILQICKQNLSPSGVAYVSYNTYPGWRMRGIIRDIMMYRSRNLRDPLDRLNRAKHLIDFLAKSVPEENNAYGVLLRKELEVLKGHNDYYLLHDHLEETNEPCYFHEFAARAEAAGLQYLGESDFAVTSPKSMPQQMQTVLQSISGDVIELEQYMDFLRNRTFRQTLLCHRDIPIDRTVRSQRLMKMYVASEMKPETPVTDVKIKEQISFKYRSAVTKTSEPLLKAALLYLGEIWPNSVTLTELVGIARGRVTDVPAVIDPDVVTGDSARIADPLARCFEVGQVELSLVPRRYTLQIPERPNVTAVRAPPGYGVEPDHELGASVSARSATSSGMFCACSTGRTTNVRF